jgi:hypothetical protein
MLVPLPGPFLNLLPWHEQILRPSRISDSSQCHFCSSLWGCGLTVPFGKLPVLPSWCTACQRCLCPDPLLLKLGYFCSVILAPCSVLLNAPLTNITHSTYFALPNYIFDRHVILPFPFSQYTNWFQILYPEKLSKSEIQTFTFIIQMSRLKLGAFADLPCKLYMKGQGLWTQASVLM